MVLWTAAYKRPLLLVFVAGSALLCQSSYGSRGTVLMGLCACPSCAVVVAWVRSGFLWCQRWPLPRSVLVCCTSVVCSGAVLLVWCKTLRLQSLRALDGSTHTAGLQGADVAGSNSKVRVLSEPVGGGSCLRPSKIQVSLFGACRHACDGAVCLAALVFS
jgi:hypothetical protein